MKTLLCALVLVAIPAFGQTVKNPTVIIFACGADHDQHTGHEVDILDADAKVIQTLKFGTAPLDAQGELRFALNMQPIAFGRYVGRVRATAGEWKSADSEPSAVWERVPGPPSKPTVQ